MPQLYPGEKLETIASFPTLYRFLPAKKQGNGHSNNDNKPLVIFIPGMALLARVGYGAHKGYNRRDFLAYWLNELGYDVLGVSYPMEMQESSNKAEGEGQDKESDESGSSGFRQMSHCPGFNPHDMGEQVAQTARKVIDKERLASNKIIVAVWSMSGKLLKPLVSSAETHGLDLRLFLSLAATPSGIKGLNYSPPQIHASRAGFAALSESALLRGSRQMQAQNIRQEGNGIVDVDTIRHEYFGHTPVGLTNAGLVYKKSQANDGENTGTSTSTNEKFHFAHATLADFAVTEPGNYDDTIHYPYIAAIRPTSPTDLRHSLTDAAAWGIFLTIKLTVEVAGVIGNKLRQMQESDHEDDVWHTVQTLVSSAPGRLTSKIVHGNHMFFMGETGARMTAEGIDELHREAENIRGELKMLLKHWD